MNPLIAPACGFGGLALLLVGAAIVARAAVTARRNTRHQLVRMPSGRTAHIPPRHVTPLTGIYDWERQP